MGCINCYVVLPFLLSLVSGLVLPMRKPNGDPDMDSVISHVTLMEQTIAALQTQTQTNNTEMTTVKGKLQTAEQTIRILQTEVQSSSAELATVKAELESSKDEITAVKAELRLAESDMALLKSSLPKNPDPVEFVQLKTELEAVSADVKTNTKEMNILKSEVFKTETNTNFNLLITRAEVANLTSEVSLMNTKLNQCMQDAVSNKVDISRQNITEHEVAECKAATDLKTIQTQAHTVANLTSEMFRMNEMLNQAIHETVSKNADIFILKSQLTDVRNAINNASYIIHSLGTQLAEIGNKTHKDVAFRITHDHQDYYDRSGWTTLKFDTVDYNTGSGYNQATGMFRAPVSGTYIFWANVLFRYTVGNHYIYIYKEPTRIATGMGRLYHSEDFGEASTTVTIHLNEGDQIHFTTGSGSNDIYGYGRSSYGGALLRAS